MIDPVTGLPNEPTGISPIEEPALPVPADALAPDGPDQSAPAATEVGRVAGTEDATPLKFHVSLGENAYLQLDDVVVTRREVPGFGEVTTSGVVTEVIARHEGAAFASDVFLIADGIMPARRQEIAEITTTRVLPECYVPPEPGAIAARATEKDRDAALYFDEMTHKVPLGTGRDGNPIFLNLEFLDGTRGAHVSISGISGVATKTSFALFLLHSLFTCGALGARGTNAKALVFSVKGEDLLFLDQTNRHLSGPGGDDLRAAYARLGLPATPFRSVGLFAPPMPQDPVGRPHVTGRTSGVNSFWWTLAEFCANELLPYVFADAGDDKQQYTMVVGQVTSRLRRDASPAGLDGAVNVDGVVCRTWPELVDRICEKLDDDPAGWAGNSIGMGTINAFVRRLRSSQKALSSILRGDLTIPTTGSGSAGAGASGALGRSVVTSRQVTVVDLHNLHERAQRFVVGVVLASETERKEQAGPGGLLFTMIDELNKYAPRDGSSPIKDVLLDIAERGRSLGIILIGAQQTASEVERRIVSNSSVKVVGRLDPAEASRPEYGFLPNGQRQRATLAKPGTMFVSQPEIPVPLAVEFPFPAWATRLSEVEDPDFTSSDVNGSEGDEAPPRPSPFARIHDIENAGPVIDLSAPNPGIPEDPDF